MRYDLIDLRLFLNIAELGSVTAAAERCGLALASASARLKSMEETLGTALVDRHRRGVVLTSAGYTLLHHAKTIHNQISVMNGELGAHANGLRAHVRLLVNTAANNRISTFLSAFLSANPSVDIDLQEKPSHRILEMIAGGAADLGIAAREAGLSNLQQRPFQTDRLAIIAAASSGRFSRVKSIGFEEVIDYPFVGFSNGNALQEHLIRHAFKLGRHINFRVRVATLSAVCELVSADVGIAIVPEPDARASPFVRRLKIILLQNEWATRDLCICARNFAALSPQASLLANALSDGNPLP